MHRAFCSFNDDEYEALEAKAKKLGMSTSKLIEYATTLFWICQGLRHRM